jgi:Domain of unknown function (DUF4386)
MMLHIQNASPRRLARITGIFYLITILGGIFAQGFVSQRLIDFGDAAATANNILAHETLFRWGFTVYMIEMACQIVFTALFYELLKPVSRSVSLAAAFLGLAGCTIKAFARVFYLAPLFILPAVPSSAAFSHEQLQALALFSLKVNDHGAAMALAFFGFYALLTGYLIFRSSYLPRFLGVWSAIAGFGWLSFLYPPLGYRLFFYVAPFGLLGAVAIIIWLLVFGVNERRWNERCTPALPKKLP